LCLQALKPQARTSVNTGFATVNLHRLTLGVLVPDCSAAAAASGYPPLQGHVIDIARHIIDIACHVSVMARHVIDMSRHVVGSI
jgi:hypothetical protein